jgi:hypothetical protein
MAGEVAGIQFMRPDQGVRLQRAGGRIPNPPFKPQTTSFSQPSRAGESLKGVRAPCDNKEHARPFFFLESRYARACSPGELPLSVWSSRCSFFVRGPRDSTAS